MRVGVVGAGMAGLGAARTLQQSRHEVVVFEKHHEVGGRVATCSKQGFTWDTGATGISPRGHTLEAVMLNELDTSNLVRIQTPIFVHSGLRALPGDSRRAIQRYCYRSGNAELPKMLAEGLTMRLSTRIDEIERHGRAYRVLGEDFDALILTAPIPQTSALLWSLAESRPVANAHYRPCISVQLGYDKPLPPTPYSALIDPEQRHPLTWLSLESLKCPGRAPEGQSAITAQLSREFSMSNYERPDDRLAETTAAYIQRLYGPAFASPVVHEIARWKYSQPETLATFENVNQPGSRLLIASDALAGGRVEEAYDIGVRAAKLLDS